MLVALRCCNRAIRFFFQTVLVDLLTKAALRFSRLLCSRDDARPHAIWVWDAIQMSLLALIVHARPVLQEQVSFIIPRNVLQGLALFLFPRGMAAMVFHPRDSGDETGVVWDWCCMGLGWVRHHTEVAKWHPSQQRLAICTGRILFAEPINHLALLNLLPRRRVFRDYSWCGYPRMSWAVLFC